MADYNTFTPHLRRFIDAFITIRGRRLMCIFAIIAAGMLCATGVKAQTVGLKTNLLSDAFMNVNVGAEMEVAPHWSIDLTGDFNFWTLSHGRRWKHWIAQPEVRYWLCDAVSGHFFAAHLLGGQYNVAGVNLNPLNFLNNDFYQQGTRNQGWMAGVGIGYGYAFPLSRHWNVEAEIAIGYTYGKYDRYPCASCGTKIESDKTQHYFGPTKAAVNLVYIF